MNLLVQSCASKHSSPGGCHHSEVYVDFISFGVLVWQAAFHIFPTAP
jgi:hypothetical protein